MTAFNSPSKDHVENILINYKDKISIPQILTQTDLLLSPNKNIDGYSGIHLFKNRSARKLGLFLLLISINISVAWFPGMKVHV